MGRNVLVIGMHRSGTSATTRMINLLGVPVCHPSDLYQARQGNDRGHWESKSLTGFNDYLLAKLGSAWWCPPPLVAHDGIAPFLSGEREAGLATLLDAHLTPQWVWKDPRNCLLLPFWLSALPVDPVVVLSLRNVADVCVSLGRRSKFSLEWCLALCERYIGHALRSIAGLPVVCTRFERLVDEPSLWAEQARHLLLTADVDTKELPADEVTDFIDPTLAHNRHLDIDMYSLPLSAEQRDLFHLAFGLAPSYRSFPRLELPDESATTTEILARVAIKHGSRWSNTKVANGPALSTSPVDPVEQSWPEISVVFSVGGTPASAREALLGLLASLPHTAEIVVVGSGAERLVEGLSASSRARTTAIVPAEGTAPPKARQIACSLTRAPFLIFTDSLIRTHPGWVDPIIAAFSDSRVAAAGPVFRPVAAPDDCVYGLTLTDNALNMKWLRGTPPGITDVPFLTGHLMAIRRSALLDAGGLDSEMADAGVWDLEICLRLWRAGYRVVAVPDSVVAYDFDAVAVPSPSAFQSNLLRFATLHFDEDLLRAVTRRINAGDEFPSAVLNNLLGDSAARRHQFSCSLVRGTAQFVTQFRLQNPLGLTNPL